MSMRSAICLINVQVITGPDADTVADEIRTVIAQGGRDAVKPVATAAAATVLNAVRSTRIPCAGSRCSAARAMWHRWML